MKCNFLFVSINLEANDPTEKLLQKNKSKKIIARKIKASVTIEDLEANAQ